MPIVFVHGNPETSVVWRPLLAVLDRTDVTTLDLPGFGNTAPAGFSATKEAYVEWLIGELEAIGEPVDLVGHDWGGAFVVRAACERPDLLRTWTSDVLGLFREDYVWHDLAQVWQSSAGEEWVEGVLATGRDARAALLAGFGIAEREAGEMAAAFDAELGRCMLALYRSAAQPALAGWAADVAMAAARPGLALIPATDPFTGGDRFARAAAATAGARVEVLEGAGHWWMFDTAQVAADVLANFWGP